MLMRKTTLLISLLLFLSTHLYSQPVTWDSSTSYSTGALVIVGTSTYIATTSVPANNTPPNTSYWKSLEETAASLTISAEELAKLPTTDVADLLKTLPGSAPSTDGGGSTTTPTELKLFGNVHELNPGFVPGYRRDGRKMNSSIPAYFDVDGYYDRNWDVRDALQDLSNDDIQAWNHYLNNGIYEDRMFDNIFVPLEYLNIYPDLKVTFTDSSRVIDLVKTVYHWFDYGWGEGRLGRFQMPSWFDADNYMNTHHDVRDALKDSSFGKNTEAWWHFYRIGAPKEGRSFDDTKFNLDAYIASNPDLKEIFKNSDGTYDKKSAMYHYISDGNAEGRVDSFTVPTWFSVNEYKTANPDVANSSEWNSSDFLIFNHFYRFGAPVENRVLSNFNLTKYIELNKDVSNVFKGERTECMIHYISDGHREGRKAL